MTKCSDCGGPLLHGVCEGAFCSSKSRSGGSGQTPRDPTNAELAERLLDDAGRLEGHVQWGESNGMGEGLFMIAEVSRTVRLAASRLERKPENKVVIDNLGDGAEYRIFVASDDAADAALVNAAFEDMLAGGLTVPVYIGEEKGDA